MLHQEQLDGTKVSCRWYGLLRTGCKVPSSCTAVACMTTCLEVLLPVQSSHREVATTAVLCCCPVPTFQALRMSCSES
jgi:hypothetical protein